MWVGMVQYRISDQYLTSGHELLPDCSVSMLVKYAMRYLSIWGGSNIIAWPDLTAPFTLATPGSFRFYHIYASELFYNTMDQSISNSMVFALFFLLLCFIEIPVVNANSVDPNQMPHPAAPDLGLQFANYPFRGLQTKMG